MKHCYFADFFDIESDFAEYILFSFTFLRNLEKKAKDWSSKIGWRVGCNFIPSTAVNQLEMWQAETFDPQTIQKELQLANSIGFNTVRVFLYYLAWGEDKIGIKSRMHTFLNITNQFNIKTIFVLFDDCWKNDPHICQQPAPIPDVHNSQWVQCPGSSQPVYGSYQEYAQDILTEFAEDNRALFWDLYNEPGNFHHNESILSLLQDVFKYTIEVNIAQPITAGMWNFFKKLNSFQLQNSDIITFHLYSLPQVLEIQIKTLKKHGRPIIYTEYMARTIGSTFKNSLTIFKKHNVVFPWKLPEGAPIPKVWFHDIFWNNSTCYSEEECSFIKSITSYLQLTPIEFSEDSTAEILNSGVEQQQFSMTHFASYLVFIIYIGTNIIDIFANIVEVNI
ncbi:hypothetical protein ABPG72_018245 [Tetrahymena utriculariae]